MLEQLLDLDTRLFLFLNSLGVSSWDGFWLFITNKLTWIPLYILFAVFIYKNERNIWKTLLVVGFLGLLVGINDGLSNFSKYYFERPRPCQVEAILQSSLFRMVAPHCSKYGYFSAHAANHFAIATFLAYYFAKHSKYIVFFLFLWAAIVAYSRIYVGVHYPLDILTGMVIGCITACIVYKYLYIPLSFLFFKKKEKEKTARISD